MPGPFPDPPLSQGKGPGNEVAQNIEKISDYCEKQVILLAISKLSRDLGRVSNFNQSIIWHHHMKDHVEIGHLTKYDRD